MSATTGTGAGTETGEDAGRMCDLARGGTWEDVSGAMEEIGWGVEDPVTEYQDTLLSEAAASGNLEVVKGLVEEGGASLEAVSSFGATPLHRACFKNKPEVVRYLVSRGSDITARTSHDNSTPLMKLSPEAPRSLVPLLTPANT